MANFWASASLQSLAMMAADVSEVPVIAMIYEGSCPFSRERMSLPMARHVFTVRSSVRASTWSSNALT